MPTPHVYSNTASVAQLATPGMSTNPADSMIVNPATWSGYPSTFPYWVEAGQGTPSAEIMEVTGGSGSTYTVNRAQGGTSLSAHNPGDTITLIVPASHFQDAEAHAASTTGVHGVSGSVVGTTGLQTIKDKLYEGGHKHVYSDTNPPSLAAGVDVQADTADAKDAFVVNNTAADRDRRAFLLNQSGTPRFQVFQDGTVELDPASGSSRPGLKNNGSTVLSDLTLSGTLTVPGTANIGTITTLGVAGDSTLSGSLAVAGAATITGDLTAADLITAGVISAHSGHIASSNTNSGNDWILSGRYQRNDTVNEVRNFRQNGVWGVRDVNVNAVLGSSDATIWTVPFTPRDTCDIEVDLTLLMTNPAGAGANLSEKSQAIMGLKILDSTSTIVYSSDVVYTYDSEGYHTLGVSGQDVVAVSAITTQVTGGQNYTLVLHGNRTTTLGPTLVHVIGVLREAAFYGWVVNG